ncbi:MAG: helix-turn-helix domain-containing protein [Bacteroidetes bacterium]|nr:helix-turn-helix domain-containing protein [Bacteroidota bacterium]
MSSKSNELIAGLFSDSENIQILCSIYENEVSADTIANLLNLNEDEVTKKLELLYNKSLVKRRQKENSIVYSLVNPKVCDYILSLKDSIEYGKEISASE